MKKNLVSVDSGKFAIKGISNSTGKGEEFYLQSTHDETAEDVADPGSYVIEYGAHKYVFGPQASGRNRDIDKTGINHKLGAFIAIANLVDSGDEVDLVIGAPLSTFLQKSSREEFQQFMSSQENVSFKINNEPFEFKLNSVTVAPESSGLTFQETNYDLFNDDIVAVVDVGGLNTNISVYDDFNLIRSNCITINNGVYPLMESLRSELSALSGTRITEQQIRRIVKNGVLKVAGNVVDESSKVIKKKSVDTINQILNAAKDKDFDLMSFEKVIFTGGGSEDLRNYISGIVTHSKISDNCLYDNVYGWLELLKNTLED